MNDLSSMPDDSYGDEVLKIGVEAILRFLIVVALFIGALILLWKLYHIAPRWVQLYVWFRLLVNSTSIAMSGKWIKRKIKRLNWLKNLLGEFGAGDA